MSRNKRVNIQKIVKANSYIPKCTRNLISFYSRHGLYPSPTLLIKNRPFNPDSPIYYPGGTNDDPTRRIELSIETFNYEQCYYQLSHEFTHSMLNIKLNSPLSWLGELLAESSTLFTMNELGYGQYIAKIISAYYAKQETATIAAANSFIKSKSFEYLIHPNLVYFHKRPESTCADVIYNLLPTGCDFWKILRSFVALFEKINQNDFPNVFDLLEKNPMAFTDAQKEYEFLLQLLC